MPSNLIQSSVEKISLPKCAYLAGKLAWQRHGLAESPTMTTPTPVPRPSPAAMEHAVPRLESVVMAQTLAVQVMILPTTSAGPTAMRMPSVVASPRNPGKDAHSKSAAVSMAFAE